MQALSRQAPANQVSPAPYSGHSESKNIKTWDAAMVTTRFTELVGCTVPIQQAGMGAAAPPALAAAVSEAGALGMLGTARPGLTAITLADLLEQVRLLTDKPFGVNFIVAPVFLNGTSTRPPLDLKCIEIAARAAKVVEFFYGEPERRLVEMVHAGGALACWQVGSREEAIAAARAGCDFVIAQGVEAGGHVRGTTPVMTLLGEVIAAVDVPCWRREASERGERWRRRSRPGRTVCGSGRASSPRRRRRCIRSTSRP